MFSEFLGFYQVFERGIGSPIALLLLAFQIWMLVDALRRREWIWAVFIFFFSFISAALYFFLVYRQAPAPALEGFELPGAQSRRRIKELKSQIHHLDKAHHYFELGDIYLQQGKLEEAEGCYRAALEREPDDVDYLAHYGQCLLRQNKHAEARPILEKVCRDNPKHDYGYSLMALAETLMGSGETERAITVWQQVLEHHTYPRARVQLAELYLEKGRPELAGPILEEVLADEAHSTGFQRRRERPWIRRAKRRLKTVAR